jgi:hypothetical protein
MAEAMLSSFPPKTAATSAESFELLCTCASANPPPGQVARIQRWQFEGFNWDTFLTLAEHHGVRPLVAHSLVQHAPVLPRAIAQALREDYEVNLRRNLWFATELSRILQHFATKRLHAIPYKGPVLAQTAYGDLGLRSFSDLDLLISPADFASAKQALSEIGYQPSQELSPAIERLFLRTGYERSFDSAAGKNLLELQWNLLPSFYAVSFQPADFRAADFRIEALLPRTGRATLCGTDVPCLSPEDSLLVLCLHAAKHLWTRLIWIADIAETLRASKIDFGLVCSRARAMGVMRIFGVSCWLAEKLLGAPIPTESAPPEARKFFDRDPEIAKLGAECIDRLTQAATYDFDSTAYFRQIWRLRERPADRWRYLWRLLWTPGPGEVAAIALPEPLFPLYKLVRIARLSRKI